jgi:hypothetical protein
LQVEPCTVTNDKRWHRSIVHNDDNERRLRLPLHIVEFDWIDEQCLSIGDIIEETPSDGSPDKHIEHVLAVRSGSFMTITTVSSYLFSSSSLLLYEMNTNLEQSESDVDNEQTRTWTDQRQTLTTCHMSIEWCSSTDDSSRDEQLVEQSTMETNLDTYCQYDRLTQDEHRISNNIPHRSSVYTSRDIPQQSYCSPTSDYESDSVDRDNETMSDLIVNISSNAPCRRQLSRVDTPHPSRSSSSLFSTTDDTSVIPIGFVLDTLTVLSSSSCLSLTRDFLLTLGFVHPYDHMDTLHELTTTITSMKEPVHPTWIHRSCPQLETLPTCVHHELDTSSIIQYSTIHYAKETEIEHDETTTLILPFILEYGYDPNGTSRQSSVPTFEPVHMHVAIVNEVTVYHMSLADDRSTVFEHVQPIVTRNDLHWENKDQLLISSLSNIERPYDPCQSIQFITSQCEISINNENSFFSFPQAFFACVLAKSIIRNDRDFPFDIISQTMLINEVILAYALSYFVGSFLQHQAFVAHLFPVTIVRRLV